MIIVSFTSYGHRIQECAHIAAQSLVTQSVKADKVICWLKGDDKPSEALLNIKGLEVRTGYPDLGSSSKLIHCLEEFPDATIVTADDDIAYGYCWLEQLLLRAKNPAYVTGNVVWGVMIENGHIQKYSLLEEACHKRPTHSGGVALGYFLPVGYAGVVYPPHSLSEGVLDHKLCMELCPYASDIWFWTHTLIKGTKTHASYFEGFDVLQVGKTAGLHQINYGQGMNDKQFQAVYDYYPEVRAWVQQHNDKYGHRPYQAGQP